MAPPVKHSWKTTACGILALVVVLGRTAIALLDADEATNPQWDVVAATITMVIGLFFARDNNRTSEEVDAGNGT